MSLSTARIIVLVLLACSATPTTVSGVDQAVKRVPNPKRPPLADVRFVQADTNCKPDTIDRFFAPATEDEDGQEVRLDCSLRMTPGQTITKRIVYRGKGASGQTLDCGGSTILPTFFEAISDEGVYQAPAIHIRGNSGLTPEGAPDTPVGVTIRNCVIHGRVVVQSEMPFPDSDKRAGHTSRRQAQAPRNITLDRLTIIGRLVRITVGSGITLPQRDSIPTGWAPTELLYFRPGVTNSTLSNSELRGPASLAIYLDAESGHNTIKGNYIHAEATRELIAVDGSAHNRIVGNRFSSLKNGGIYLYRNCGEKGMIRHQSPIHNEIINNHFYYKQHDDEDYPAIWVGSRNARTFSFGGHDVPIGRAKTVDGNIGYCGEDDGFPFGSSLSDRDFALHNVIAENRVSRIDEWGFDKFFNIVDQPTYAIRNVRVSNDEIALMDRSSMRRSGCFRLGLLISDGLRDKGVFVRDGQYLRNPVKHPKSWNSLRTGDPAGRLRCDDGDWTDGGPTEVAKVFDQARVSDNSNGARKVLNCPAGKRIVSFRASCNLELNQAPGLSMVPWNQIQVRQKSDRVDDGACAVSYRWSAEENRNVSIKQGSATLEELLSAHVTEAGLHCRDHDQNGGDCFIRAEAVCM